MNLSSERYVDQSSVYVCRNKVIQLQFDRSIQESAFTRYSLRVIDKPAFEAAPMNRRRAWRNRRFSGLVHYLWEMAVEAGAIGASTKKGKLFGSFGEQSVICFPANTIFNERFIHIGRNTMIGPDCTLSAGMVPGQQCLSDRIVTIGNRCLIGKGTGIVGHFSIEIGDDVWTGHNVYITDQNHGYEDITRPISVQTMPEKSVRIGNGSWLGYGTVVLPGADIGEHVVIGANSVVTGTIPSFSVAVGSPAKVIRRYENGVWETVGS